MTSLTRRTALALAALSLPSAARGQAAAGAWTPNRPLRIVVPFGPGTSADGAARILAEDLAPRFGVPVVIDNRGGASTTLGAAEVARAAPDGHTLLIAPPPFVITQFTMPRLPYNPETAFRPVAQVATSPVYLVVRADLPARTVPELLAMARAKPGDITYASVGPGSQPHVTAELTSLRAGIELLHVPYRTGVLAGTDLVAGRVDVMFTSLPAVRNYVESGQVRLLASISRERQPGRPEIPAISEFIPPVRAEFWLGFLAPAATPDGPVRRWHAEISALLDKPVVRERFANLDLIPTPRTTEEFALRLQDERRQWGEALRAVNIQMD